MTLYCPFCKNSGGLKLVVSPIVASFTYLVSTDAVSISPNSVQFGRDVKVIPSFVCSNCGKESDLKGVFIRCEYSDMQDVSSNFRIVYCVDENNDGGEDELILVTPRVIHVTKVDEYISTISIPSEVAFHFVTKKITINLNEYK